MRTTSLFAIALSFVCATGVSAQGRGGGGGGQAAPIQTIDARTTGLQKIDGYMPLYWDDKTGSLWMEINKLDTEMLYSTGLTAGLGSNDIGLDRGQSGQGRVVKFQRIGPRVMMVQPNYTWRANSPNPDERRAVEDAFAKSILWGFAVGAETDGRVLVDATDFFLRDVVNVGPRLGNYRVDRTRSAFNLPQTKGFPKNTEIDTMLTFSSEGGGAAGGGRGGGGRGGGGFGGGMFSGSSAASRRRRMPSRCASTTPSPSCPTPTTSRGSTIRARVSARCSTPTTPRRSRRRSSSASPGGIGSRRWTRPRA